MTNADVNMRLERVAHVVSTVLAEKRGLPAPLTITIHRGSNDVISDVELQMSRLEHLAVWATAFGVQIRLTDHDTHVRVTATRSVDGDIVFEAWGHMPHGDAWRLLSQHDKQLTKAGVEVSPDEVLADLSQLAGGK